MQSPTRTLALGLIVLAALADPIRGLNCYLARLFMLENGLVTRILRLKQDAEAVTCVQSLHTYSAASTNMHIIYYKLWVVGVMVMLVIVTYSAASTTP